MYKAIHSAESGTRVTWKVVGIVALGVCVLSGFERCQAATFTVDTTSDTEDADPGDGVAEDSNGDTSVRAAFMEANALSGDDTIVIPAGNYNLAYDMYSPSDDMAQYGDLDVRYDKITVTGAGSTGTTLTQLFGSAPDGYHRMIDVHGSATLDISDVVIRDTYNDEGGDGGGIYMRANSTAHVTDCKILNCDNASGGYGAGISVLSGAELYLTDSVIEGCDGAIRGGGIGVLGGYAEIDGSTIKLCSASDDGGGLMNEDGTVIMTSSFVQENEATIYGAGICNHGKSGETACMDLTSVTIEDNDNVWGDGGGVMNYGTDSATDGYANLDLSACTVRDNITGHSDVPAGGSGGGIINGQDTVSCVCLNDNTVVSNNTSRAGVGHDTYGTIGSNCSCDTCQ